MMEKSISIIITGTRITPSITLRNDSSFYERILKATITGKTLIISVEDLGFLEKKPKCEITVTRFKDVVHFQKMMWPTEEACIGCHNVRMSFEEYDVMTDMLAMACNAPSDVLYNVIHKIVWKLYVKPSYNLEDCWERQLLPDWITHLHDHITSASLKEVERIMEA